MDYQAVLHGLKVGDAGVITMEPWMTLRGVQRRLRLTAKTMGFDLTFAPAQGREIPFKVVELGSIPEVKEPHRAGGRKRINPLPVDPNRLDPIRAFFNQGLEPGTIYSMPLNGKHPASLKRDLGIVAKERGLRLVYLNATGEVVTFVLDPETSGGLHRIQI